MPTPFAFAAPLAVALSSAAAPADQTATTAAIAVASPAIVLSAAAPLPTNPITPQEALTSLQGTWSGSLTYRDYGTQRLESIPVALAMEVQPDGQTIVQRFDYTDPGFQVYVTNLVTVKDGVLSGATARAGRAFETYEKTITVTRQAMSNQWTIILEDETSDDDRPARIRETMTRAQGTLKVLKEVDYLDDGQEEWIFRNEIILSARD
ncbi:MAG: hypothetical protein AAGJ68_15845 [Pseudomonadota bacterium]